MGSEMCIRDRFSPDELKKIKGVLEDTDLVPKHGYGVSTCLLYTSDAADDMQWVDLGGPRIIKKRQPPPTAPPMVASTPHLLPTRPHFFFKQKTAYEM